MPESVVEDPELEEKSSSSDPAEEVKEDVVIIDGKPRPLKNFMAETARKIREDVVSELEAKQPEPQSQDPQSQPAGGDWMKDLSSQAEREMEETGSLIPVKTITNLIAQGTNFHLNEFNKSNKKAQKIIKDTKRDLRSQYKNFKDYEEEFDVILEDIDPRTVSKEGITILFNSIRGKHLDDILEKQKEDSANKGKEKVIGAIDSTPGSQPQDKGKAKLSQEQIREMTAMAFESEEDYMGRLDKVREIAKRKGAKNVPYLIAERLEF